MSDLPTSILAGVMQELSFELRQLLPHLCKLHNEPNRPTPNASPSPTPKPHHIFARSLFSRTSGNNSASPRCFIGTTVRACVGPV